MADEEKTKLTFGVAEAIFLAVVTATTYLCAFGYEQGYCNHFAIPSAFIRVSTEILLTSFVSLALSVIAAGVIANYTIKIATNTIVKRNTAWEFVYQLNVAALGIGVFLGWSFGYSWKGIRAFFISIIFIQLFLFLVGNGAIFASRLFGRLFQRTQAGQSVPVASFDALQWVVSRIPPHYLIMVGAAWFLFTFSGFAGLISASRERTFSKIDQTNMVIIRRFNDSFVCKKLIDNPERLQAGFSLISLDSLKDQHLSTFTFKTELVIEDRDFTSQKTTPPQQSPPATPAAPQVSPTSSP